MNLADLAELRELTRSGEALRLRKRKNIRRSEMAEKVGVSYVCFQKWELGVRSPSGEAASRYLQELRALARGVVWAASQAKELSEWSSRVDPHQPATAYCCDLVRFREAGATLQQLANAVGVTRERVRQILLSPLCKCMTCRSGVHPQQSSLDERRRNNRAHLADWLRGNAAIWDEVEQIPRAIPRRRIKVDRDDLKTDAAIAEFVRSWQQGLVDPTAPAVEISGYAFVWVCGAVGCATILAADDDMKLELLVELHEAVVHQFPSPARGRKRA